MVADAQQLFRLFMKEILREAGYVAKCVATGIECLNIARSDEKPFLILLGYNIPSLTGIEVLVMLKEDMSTKDIPVIMITSTDDIESEAKSLGALAVLMKPSNIEEIVTQINLANA